MKETLNQCLSKGDPNLLPDLHAINNGATQKYNTFFSVAKRIFYQINGAEAYQHTKKRYIIEDNVDLTSIPALYQKKLSQ